MSRDKENLRNLPCEKKFDNSIIRDINPETLRDSPCEEKFDNSQIRDNKTVTLRDSPCENKPIRKFYNAGQKENSCEKTVTSATIRVKSKHDIPREEPRATAALSPGTSTVQ